MKDTRRLGKEVGLMSTTTTRIKIKKVRVLNDREARKPRKPRLYIFPAGETVLEQFLVGRHTRPVKLWRTLLPEILKRARMSPDTKARWSQYAGCSCPCSPGFILTDTGRHDFALDVFVDVEAVKKN